MYNPQTHYRAFFSIEKGASSSHDHIYQAIVNHIGRWLQYHDQFRGSADQIFKPWLYQGADKQVTGKLGAWAEVRTDSYISETRSAENWVMRVEHTDTDYRARKWRIDIALSCHTSAFAEFTVTVTRFLRNNYMGEEPPIPPSSIPRFVSNILNDSALKCFVGNKRLQPTAQQLTAGDGRSLFEFITAPNRIVPVILINLHYLGNDISPDGLQKLVLGSGIVYWYNDHSVHSELAYFWGKSADQYQCGPDSIRIYLPEVVTSSWFDWKRHRYFQLAKYEGSGGKLIGIISQSIFRVSSRNIVDNHISNFETLFLIQQKKRMATLRKAAMNTPRSAVELEYLNALEQENLSVQAKLDELQGKLSSEEESNVLLELQMEELQNQLTASQEQFASFGVLEGQYKKTMGDQVDKRMFCSQLPKTLAEDLKFIADIFPERLIVLDSGYDSAEKAKFQYISDAHGLLYQMATTLHSIFFDSEDGDIENSFRVTGYELTLKESSATKADRRLMDLRKRVYEGKLLDFSPHTKLERLGKDLRIHFIADHEKKLLVIGHCGDHLETAGTARRKEA